MTDARAENPFVFIVGCPRSGTTLLERMANAHPSLAIIHESHWISRFFKKHIGVTRDGTVTIELIEALCRHHRFHLLGITRHDVERLIYTTKRLSYANFVSGVFDLYGQRAGKPNVGDKTTGGYLRNIALLHGLWPCARFVHLIRDGRDVCLSMLNWKKANRAAGRLKIWNDNPVATTALWWQWQVRLGLNDGATLASDEYYEMRYETLVRDPHGQCEALCSFLGLPYDERMIRFYEGRTSTEPGLSANRAWLPPTPKLRNWRTQMPLKDIELFEAIAGDLLFELGYDCLFETISLETTRVAERFRRWWDMERTRLKHNVMKQPPLHSQNIERANLP